MLKTPEPACNDEQALTDVLGSEVALPPYPKLQHGTFIIALSHQFSFQMQISQEILI